MKTRSDVIAMAKEAGISHKTWDHQDKEAAITFYNLAFEAGRVAEQEICKPPALLGPKRIRRSKISE